MPRIWAGVEAGIVGQDQGGDGGACGAAQDVPKKGENPGGVVETPSRR